jgi:molybdopterin-guanine dinucleotide biosynthesis protein B
VSNVFGIVGWKNSGKTTLVSSLVREFTNRGLSISTIKHAHHTFSLDQTGTDSSRHRAAGAHEVALASSRRWAIMHEVACNGEEPSLETMISKMAPCDLILVEGYKGSDINKIEAIRQGTTKEEPLWQTHSGIVAVASDVPLPKCNKPRFDLDDISGVADFIIQKSGVRL